MTQKNHTRSSFQITPLSDPLQQPRQGLPAAASHTAADYTLYAICLGPFEIRYQDRPLTLCANRNGQAILRYLLTQSHHCASTDTLMTLFWPEETPKIGLRKLQVTISILRHALRDENKLLDSYILYRQGVYQLNPSFQLHSDVAEFMELYNLGAHQRETRTKIASYEKACALYTRPFLLEDLYADWSYTQREHLSNIYLNMCYALSSYYLDSRDFDQASHWATVILDTNPCDEEAYRILMRIYTSKGQRAHALRVYHRCTQVLRDELCLQPMPETTDLYRAIVHGETND